jgi:hypothetical protein
MKPSLRRPEPAVARFSSGFEPVCRRRVCGRDRLDMAVAAGTRIPTGTIPRGSAGAGALFSTPAGGCDLQTGTVPVTKVSRECHESVPACGGHVHVPLGHGFGCLRRARAADCSAGRVAPTRPAGRRSPWELDLLRAFFVDRRDEEEKRATQLTRRASRRKVSEPMSRTRNASTSIVIAFAAYVGMR